MPKKSKQTPPVTVIGQPPLAPLKKTNLKLNQPAVDCMARLKARHGIGQTFAIERGVILLETQLNNPGRGI
jgi:hypothetical protein